MATQTVRQPLEAAGPVKPVQHLPSRRKPVNRDVTKHRFRSMSTDSNITLAEQDDGLSSYPLPLKAVEAEESRPHLSALQKTDHRLLSKDSTVTLNGDDEIKRPEPSALQNTRNRRLLSKDSAITLAGDDESTPFRGHSRTASSGSAFEFSSVRRKSSVAFLDRARFRSTDSAMTIGSNSDDGSQVQFTDNYPTSRKSFRGVERPVFKSGFFSSFGENRPVDEEAAIPAEEIKVDPLKRVSDWQAKQQKVVPTVITIPTPVTRSSSSDTQVDDLPTPGSRDSVVLASPDEITANLKSIEFQNRLETYIPAPAVVPQPVELLEKTSERLETLGAQARLEPEAAVVRLEEEVGPAVVTEKAEKEEEDGLPKPIAAAAAVKPTSRVRSYLDAKLAAWETWSTLNLSQDPDMPLVLPSPPTDTEKLCYLDSNRKVLFGSGVFSFLALAAGLWLFVQANPAFYWFGVIAGFLQIYLSISYFVGLTGKDFDYKGHLKVLEDFPITEDTAPTVDIYLPCCKEPMNVIRNTYKYVQALKYPAGKLNVYVLDDGALDEVKQAAEEFGFNYICRDNRPYLKKAGNLRYAFTRTEGEFFVIFDADFCPREDFLLESIPEHLAHPNYAILQTPQFFRVVKEQSWVERGAGATQELFYRYVQVNRDRWGAPICVGSCAIYRREALVETGGTAEIGHSEDVHTGFFAMTRGWRVKYMPINLALGICPDTCKAFFSQQNRWCTGSTTLFCNPEFWHSCLTPIQKMCFSSGMMYYSATAVAQFVNPLPGILLIWAAPRQLVWYNLAFVIPSLINSTLVYNWWSRAKSGNENAWVKAIQAFAHLSAIKDKMLGTSLAWVPSGDSRAHKSTKYRNMRRTAIFWTAAMQISLFVGMGVRIPQGLTGWYNFVPMLLINFLNLWSIHKFLLCGASK